MNNGANGAMLVWLALRDIPRTVLTVMMQELTTLKVEAVLQSMSPDDHRFVQQLIRSIRSGAGVMNNLDHRADRLPTIQAPCLMMYPRYDRSVPLNNA